MFFFDEIIELSHEHMCNQIMDLAMEQVLEESGKSRREAQETAVFCQVDDMMYSALPWAVFFDGFTAWTVNHMDLVPDMVNRIAHLLFFLLMDLTIIITTAYTFDQLLGFRKSGTYCTSGFRESSRFCWSALE